MFKFGRAKPTERAKNERPPPAERERVTPEVLGRELREALRQVRVHSISIHNDECDALWLSEGVLGPDEHSAALEAMGAFGLETQRHCSTFDLGDGRSAVTFPARSPYGEVLGLAMVIADSKSIENGGGERLGTADVRAILQRLSVVLRPTSITQTQPIAKPEIPAADLVVTTLAGPAAAPPVEETRSAAVPASPAPASTEGEMPVVEFSFDALLDPQQEPAPAPALAPASMSAPVARPALAAPPQAAPPAPAASHVVDASADATLYVPQATVREVALHVQQLHKLRSGGRTRRYEVLLRARSQPDADAMGDTVARMLASQGTTSTMDRYITGELITWLAAHPGVWEREPASFSVNLALTTLTDEQFLPFVSNNLSESRVSPEIIGFEVPERAFVEHRTFAERFVKRCEQLGCFIVLDDFTLHSEALPFLASPAVRLVKIDPKLTSAALKEKLPQAVVIAISQAAKVLGVHCVAKRVDSQVGRQWLSAIGIDFAQGFLLEKPQPLDDLSQSGQPNALALSP